MAKNLAWQLEQLAKMPAEDGVASHGYDYVTIRFMQDTLDRIFDAVNWSWIVKNSHYDMDHATVTGDLIVTFSNGKVKTVSGVGAAQLRKKKDYKTGAVIGFIEGGATMDLPNADSKAFKNACQKLGDVFGRRLRSDPDTMPDDKKPRGASQKTVDKIKAATAKELAKEQKFKFGIAAWNKERCLEWLAKYKEDSLEFAKYGHLVNARYEQIFGEEVENGK